METSQTGWHAVQVAHALPALHLTATADYGERSREVTLIAARCTSARPLHAPSAANDSIQQIEFNDNFKGHANYLSDYNRMRLIDSRPRSDRKINNPM